MTPSYWKNQYCVPIPRLRSNTHIGSLKNNKKTSHAVGTKRVKKSQQRVMTGNRTGEIVTNHISSLLKIHQNGVEEYSTLTLP